MSTLPRPIFPDNWPPKPMRKWPPSWRCWTFGARCAGWCPAGLSPRPASCPGCSNPQTASRTRCCRASPNCWTPATTPCHCLGRARRLAARESFFHWWTSFPTVFGGGDKARATPGGFDAIIGNPPWDRIKLQEVEWFAERDLHIAAQARAADRKRLIGALQSKKSPLWQSYLQASERAQANARVLGNGRQGSGDYPLLGGGDINLYSLFV